jgi:outer membrane protein assembly factor BamB
VVGSTAYGPAAEGRCVTATDVGTGHVDWSVATPSDHPELFDVIADASIVLAATGVEPPQTGGLEAPVVGQLVAYDPTTGHPTWDVVIPGDSQRIPAVLAGPVVVVSQADGSVVGLSETNGNQLWRNPAPRGCSGNDTSDGTEPNAAMLGTTTINGDLSAVVGFACPAGGGVAAIDPSNGHIRWKWPVPKGWELDMQVATTVHTGVPSGDVIAAAISLIPAANAPKVVAPPPGPAMPTRIPNTYGYSQTSDVAVLDPGTGRTLWDLTDVVGQLLTAGGSGTLCVLTDAGADCRNARNGVPRWSTSWPGSDASPSAPALGCIDESAGDLRCAVATNGLLYVALATPAAPVYPPGPDPPTPAGAFLITALSMTNGKTTATIPLPSFNVQSDHAVSLGVPPAVLLVAGGVVLVTPQFEETDVVEAFALPAR